MIAKHVPMRALKKSDFSDLVKYLVDDQGKEHRVGDIQITNCDSSTLSAVIPEILATQKLNTRSNSDKTYHLIISFRAGEQPSKKVLQAVEEKVCSGLGFSEHQRVSVTHRDTDNLHIHVAINKIHPQKNTIFDPFQAYKKLGKICIELENEFGLERDNHEHVRSVSENLASDMEHHSGQESLVSWIRDNCLQQFNAAHSWKAFHQVCAEYGLSLKKRGAGFVFQYEELFVKASTIDRSLSKAALEKRLGEFEVGEPKATQKKRKTYQSKPKQFDKEKSDLYDQYLQYNHRLNKERPIRAKELKKEKSRAYLDAQKKYKLKVRAIKALTCSYIIKKILFRNAYRTLVRSNQSIQKHYRQEQKQLYRQLKKRTWFDWLKEMSSAGHKQALKLLRAREKRSPQGNIIYFESESTEPSSTHKKFQVDGITKKGTVIYRVSHQTIREQRNHVQLPEDATDFTILSAIDMAQEKGGAVSLKGSAKFKAKVIQLSAYFNRKIWLKNDRLRALKNKLEEEISYERRTRRNDTRRRAGGRSSESTGRRGSSQRIQGGYRGDRVHRTNPVVSRNPIAKPNISGIGKAPPPESRNRLRELSELGVVHLTDRSEVLLPSDVSRDMEQQNTQSIDCLRWDVSKSGITENHIGAVKRYIEEREKKRALGIDIPKHSMYTGFHKVYSFAGVRNIDQFSMALLSVDNAIEVLPIDDATVKRLSRIKIGHQVTVTNKGLIRIKRGRSR